MERIRIEVVWDTPVGTLERLENEGGDVTLVLAALAAAESHRDGGTNDCEVNSISEEV